jgi:hypothetical protein
MRNIFIILFVFVCLQGFSQDIIITKEGKSIKTKVIELTDEKVSYKKYDYQEGATIILDLSKVKTIVWESGEVEDFNIEDVAEKAVEVPEILPSITSHKMGKVAFSDGNYLYPSEFWEYLAKNNMLKIREQYFSGMKLSHTGTALLIAGLAASAGGGLLLGLWLNSLVYDIYGGMITGFVLIGVGEGLTIASIPCLVVGSVKRNIAVDNYHKQSGVNYSYQPTLNIGFTGNGFGVTLNF